MAKPKKDIMKDYRWPEQVQRTLAKLKRLLARRPAHHKTLPPMPDEVREAWRNDD